MPSYIHLSHSRIHTVDLISIKALRLVLRDSEKTLEAYWKEEDLQRVKSLLLNHPLAEKNHILEGNFVVISPAITWPSRTLPLAYYQELITAIQKKGIGVILVGKDITYQRGVDCNKTLYPSEFFQDAISLYNQLTFAELAALYSITPIAINTENGNNPISCTNDFCWNLYIPSLTAPEFRLPFRHGSQKYKTAVAANDLDYYPSCIHGDTGMNSYLNMPVLFPTVSHVLEMLDRIRTKIRENAHFLT